jgi:hypothetical protein
MSSSLERKFIRFADPIPLIIPMTPSIADLMRPKISFMTNTRLLTVEEFGDAF